MNFHMCDGITGQTIDIVEDRCLDNLINYFFYYDYKARIMICKGILKQKKQYFMH